MGCEYINPREEEQQKYYRRVKKLREAFKNLKLSEFEAQELPALTKLLREPMGDLFEGDLCLLEARLEFIDSDAKREL